MRILHVIPSVARRDGGPSQAVLDMCRAVSERGATTLIATTDADGPGRLRVPLGVPDAWDGVPAIFFRYRFSERFKYSGALAAWLRRHCRDFDVVHVHAVFSHASLAAGAACRRSGVRYIVRPLGSLEPWSLQQRALLKRIMWHGGVGRLLHGAAAIHYTTQEEQRGAETSDVPKRGVVVPLGVDAGWADRPPGHGAFARRLGLEGVPYVLTLSRLHPKKGLDLLLDAFQDVVQQPRFSAWRLVVAGDGAESYVASLKRRARSPSGPGAVMFVGWLDGPVKVDALQSAALFALPSHQENFALAAAEAMASGVPVLVGTGVNLAPEIVSAEAGWVSAPTRRELTATLESALANAEERRRRGAAGRALVARDFTWERIAPRLMDLYHAVADTTVVGR
jgi:glycosyltransferase involved in cell wall biosynthesis